MNNSNYSEERIFNEAYECHFETVYRACYIYLKANKDYIDDAVQNTFLQLLKRKDGFESLNHEKAWLITVASNISKNMVSHWWNRNTAIDKLEIGYLDPSAENSELMENIFQLPHKYKQVIYMHYYLGYSGVEISKMLNVKENTVYSYLHKGRDLLKNMLKEELV